MKLVLCFLFMLGVNTIYAQKLFVKQTDGTQSNIEISEIKKIILPDNDITIEMYSGSEKTFAMTDINYLSFTDSSISVINASKVSHNLIIYPVPVNDLLNVRYSFSENRKITIQITDMQGRVVRTFKQKASQSVGEININVIDLPDGYYNCSIDNGLSVQTQKFIKQ
jgi:hypothetical protein